MNTNTKSKLTREQKRCYRAEYVDENGDPYVLVAEVRYDDSCNNGNNTFTVTATLYAKHVQRGEPTTLHKESGRKLWVNGGGCLHEDIAKRLPELAPFIKWHLCSSDGPLHYLANTLYHVEEHGPTHAWVYFTGQSDPLSIGPVHERLIGYIKADEARKAEGAAGYRVEWDTKTAKSRNLEFARSTAVWPSATDEDLTAPGLKERLEARLPALLIDFRRAVESLAFVW